jgi:hypothetical protein
MLHADVRFIKLRIIILRGAALPAWLEDGRIWGEEGLELELDALMVRVLILRNRSISFFGDMSTAVSEVVDEVKSFAMEAYTLDYDLALWALRLPQDWNFHIRRTLSQPNSYETDARVAIPSHTYPSVGHASIWNRYCALRLIANSIQKRALCTLQSLFNHDYLKKDMQRCQDNINKLAADLCCGIEFSITGQAIVRGFKTSLG